MNEGVLGVGIPLGEPAQLTGKIIDPGTQGAFSLIVTWGDSKEAGDVEIFHYTAGTESFSESHTYQDVGAYMVTVDLRGDDFSSDLVNLTITVDPLDGEEDEGSQILPGLHIPWSIPSLTLG